MNLLPGDRQVATAQVVINAETRGMDAIAHVLEPLARDYDHAILDAFPSVGGIQERAFFASDFCAHPGFHRLPGAEWDGAVAEAAECAAQARLERGMAGILPTFYDEQTTASRESLASLRKNFAEQVLDPIHRAAMLRMGKRSSRWMDAAGRAWNTERCASGRAGYETRPFFPEVQT